MVEDLSARQEREWAVLYQRIQDVLRQFGKEDEWGPRKRGDYFLLDENLGLFEHKIETDNLEMVKPLVIKSLQKSLMGYPDWEIVIAVGSPENENWPTMGLVISDDEIIDGLQRQYLPEEFKSIQYEGSRPVGTKFSDIFYTGPGGLKLQ